MRRDRAEVCVSDRGYLIGLVCGPLADTLCHTSDGTEAGQEVPEQGATDPAFVLHSKQPPSTWQLLLTIKLWDHLCLPEELRVKCCAGLSCPSSTQLMFFKSSFTVTYLVGHCIEEKECSFALKIFNFDIWMFSCYRNNISMHITLCLFFILTFLFGKS